MSKRNKNARNNSFMVILKTCFFLALKYILDDTIVLLKDFSAHAEIDQEVLQQLEITLLVDVLKFEVNFSETEYHTELTRIAVENC